MITKENRPNAKRASHVFADPRTSNVSEAVPKNESGRREPAKLKAASTACQSEAYSGHHEEQAQTRIRVLFDERPLVLLPSLAKAVGVDQAIVLQQLHYYLVNPKCGHEHDGHRWIFNTYEDWQAQDFPFWPAYRVGQNFRRLEQRRLLISCQPESYADGVGNRRKYYRINYEQLEKIVTAAAPRACARVRDHCKTQRSDGAKTQRSRTETSSIDSHHFASLSDVHISDVTRVSEEKTDLASPSSSTPVASSMPNSWHDEYTSEALEVIDDYNARLVPRGWRPVDCYSPELALVLDIFMGSLMRADFIAMLNEAADERDAGDSIFYNTYNAPRGNKLIRILWTNY